MRSVSVPDEAALMALAAQVAHAWQAHGRAASVTVGLCGDLGAGKTTWVRAMLRALGHSGRVPSPTYTLMEIYDISPISLIHMDLYRLNGDAELAQLGIRDYLGQAGCWLIAEWPERAPQWFARCDIVLRLSVTGAQSRRIECAARAPEFEFWLAPFELT